MRSRTQRRALVAAWSSAGFALLLTPPVARAQSPGGPPVAPVRLVVDTLYGVPVRDPYRYMENLADTAVANWFRRENSYTRSVLDRIPSRAALLADIEKYDRSQPATVSNVMHMPGDLYFYEKTLPDQQVARLYVRRGLHGPERVVCDPTRYETKGGPQWAINYYSPSFDGRYVAVGVSPGGSERAVLHVLDTGTGRQTGDVIVRAWFGAVEWRPDNHSFFYNQVRALPDGAPPSATEEESHVKLHILGTDPSRDRTVFGYRVSPSVPFEPTDIPAVLTTRGSTWALGVIQHGTKTDVTLYAVPLDSMGTSGAPWHEVVGLQDDVVGFVDVDNAPNGIAVRGDELYMLSHKGAPRYRLLRISLRDPDMAHAVTVLPQSDVVLKRVFAAQDALYVQELDGVVGRILRIPYQGGTPTLLNLPFAGTVGMEGADPGVDGIVFGLTSWTRPNKLYAYDPRPRKVTDTRLQPAGPYDAAQDLVSKEVTVRSYDGTMVPLSISYPRGMKLDGTHPVLLRAYGAYGITLYPTYFLMEAPWFAHGGVFAVAHVRGGGVYGSAWHEGGYKLTKPNTWRDLIACAEYLIRKGYTSSSRLTIVGGSAGGVTVGRAMTERPDLFTAVLDLVGLSNPLRFEFTANGPPNIPEFGSIKTEAGFEDLYAMDSYEHVRDGVRYPAVLLTTGWNDPRVISWQPGKMAARLQAATASGKPVLLSVNYRGGHGFGSSRADLEQEFADLMAFALWQSGVPGFQPRKGARLPALRR